MEDDHKGIRNNLRNRSFLRGEIMHSGGASRTLCTIRDLSETGARIQIPLSVTLPEIFELFVPIKKLQAIAKIVWFKDDEIGVIFKNSYASDQTEFSIQQELIGRIKHLEHSLFELRKDIDVIINFIYTNEK